MFDILVYVFENYLPEACPEPGALARKLSAVGFEEGLTVAEGLIWSAAPKYPEDVPKLAALLPPGDQEQHPEPGSGAS